MYESWINPQKKKIYFVRTRTLRALHWILFLSITTLFLTGYYIGDPTFFFGTGEAYNQSVMADIRLIHFAAAVVMTVVVLLRIYLAFFSRFNKDWIEWMPTPSRLKGAAEIFKSYFSFKRQPYYDHLDPLDGILFLLFLVVSLVQILTGFALYAEGLSPDYWWGNIIRFFTSPIVWILDANQNIRLIHHAFLWIMLTGVIIHVYLQLAKTFIWKNGHIASIFGGFKFRDVE